MADAGAGSGYGGAAVQSDRSCDVPQFCVYRRYMKRQISGEMQGRVDDMVSKYIEFYSERNK